MSRVFSNSNPSQMYMDALIELSINGEEYAPRGKRIKELRPVILEYRNPLSRVTFLKGRVINPFFQLAEALWITVGRSDVKWLTQYNKSIAQFSDNGVYFNAPYGERLRHWGKNDARGFIFSPIDQLVDCYHKLQADPDTRQAVAFIGNPRFDSSEYTLNGGKDIACNLNIKFKIRKGKLDISVDNRSNDLHWGTFGANLCQFATIQEMMASWLGIEVGTYYQITDSLHIYLDDYGSLETTKVFNAYSITDPVLIHPAEYPCVEQHYWYQDEPRMSSSMGDFINQTNYFFNRLDPIISNPSNYDEDAMFGSVGVDGMIASLNKNIKDKYLNMTISAMIAYQAHKNKSTYGICMALGNIPDCSWKVSCLRFLSKSHKEKDMFKELYSHLPQGIKSYINREGE